MVKTLLEHFVKKNCKKEEVRIEKVIKKKGDNLYVTWKGYDNPFNHLIVGLIKKILYKNESIFS